MKEQPATPASAVPESRASETSFRRAFIGGGSRTKSLGPLAAGEERVGVALEKIRQTPHRVGGIVEVHQGVAEFLADPCLRSDERPRGSGSVAERLDGLLGFSQGRLH